MSMRHEINLESYLLERRTKDRKLTKVVKDIPVYGKIRKKMYGIPGYNGTPKRRSTMSFKDWCICIGVVVGVLTVTLLVCYGALGLYTDTQKEIYHSILH